MTGTWPEIWQAEPCGCNINIQKDDTNQNLNNQCCLNRLSKQRNCCIAGRLAQPLLMTFWRPVRSEGGVSGLSHKQGGRTLDSQQNNVSWRKGALCVARIPCAPVALFACSESSAQRRTTSRLTNGETADTISVRAATRTSLQTNTAPFRRLRCVAPCTGNVPKTSKVRSSCEHVHC